MAAVRDALSECEGVQKVEVEFESRTATAIIDEKTTDTDKLLAALEAAGYEGSSVK